MSRVRVLHGLRWKCNCSCVLNVDSGINPQNLIKFHQVLNKIMLIILWLFYRHSVSSLWRVRLSIHLKNCDLTLTTFMRHLKSYLFSQY